MPATISATLSSAMPAAAADSPVKALSSEITTGMSAPPIGSTNMLPRMRRAHQDRQEQQLGLGAGSDRHRAGHHHEQQDDVHDLLARQLDRPPGQDLLQLAEGDVRAPEGDRADDRREQDRHQLLQLGVAARSSSESRYSTNAISATAPPPTPLNSATICGIAVIFTLRAAGTPTAVPTAMPTAISR